MIQTMIEEYIDLVYVTYKVIKEDDVKVLRTNPLRLSIEEFWLLMLQSPWEKKMIYKPLIMALVDSFQYRREEYGTSFQRAVEKFLHDYYGGEPLVRALTSPMVLKYQMVLEDVELMVRPKRMMDLLDVSKRLDARPLPPRKHYIGAIVEDYNKLICRESRYINAVNHFDDLSIGIPQIKGNEPRRVRSLSPDPKPEREVQYEFIESKVKNGKIFLGEQYQLGTMWGYYYESDVWYELYLNYDIGYAMEATP
jgi:hypothetical protein